MSTLGISRCIFNIVIPFMIMQKSTSAENLSKYLFMTRRINDKGSVTHFKNLKIDGIIDIKLRFLTLSSFEIWFESVINVLVGQTTTKYDLWRSNVTTGKYLLRLTGTNVLYFFGLKIYDAVWELFLKW